MFRLENMSAFEALKARNTKRVSVAETTALTPLVKVKSKGMNKAETFYSYELERQRKNGEIQSWKYESIRLTLAEKTTYTPDFLVWMKNGDICLHEVKAVWRKTGKPHWEDDARAKTKIAAEMFPEFAFYGVWWDQGQFHYEYFKSRIVLPALAKRLRTGEVCDL